MSNLVVIGGSAGAIPALKTILAALPASFPAAILVVTHIGTQRSLLPEILQRVTPLPVRHATDGEPIIAGRVLLAPSDEHLTVVTAGDQRYVRLAHGPKENHCRPAIDPLFRSAAAACGAATTGVILSGYLDDGTVGMQAVKARGGMAIVQDPADAEVPDMPASAIDHAAVDMILAAREIAPALVQLAARSVVPVQPAGPDWIDIENRLTGKDSDMEDLDQIGTPSSLTCPECSGALWEINPNKTTGPVRYRCHTGHAFTARILAAMQGSEVEEAIWGAIRALHEQERLYTKMCEKALELGHAQSSADYLSKAQQARQHAQSLREVIATRALVVTRGESA
jgi:two-component system chemotaxis response regulator CheB